MDQICQHCNMPMIGAPGETLTSCPMCGAAIEEAAPVERTVMSPAPTSDSFQEPDDATDGSADGAKAAKEEAPQEEAPVEEAPQEAPAASVPDTAEQASEASADGSVDDDNAFAFVAEESTESDEPTPAAQEAPAPAEPAAEASTDTTSVTNINDVIPQSAVITEPAATPQRAEAPKIAAEPAPPKAPEINPMAPSVQFAAPDTPVAPTQPQAAPQPAQPSAHLQQLASQSAQPPQQVQPQMQQMQPQLRPQSLQRPSATGQFQAAPGTMHPMSPSGQYFSPQLPSATGQFYAMQGSMLPSATGQFPAMRMPLGPGASGTFPVQGGGQPPQRFVSSYNTGTFVAPTLPSQTGQFQAAVAPQAPTPGPGPSATLMAAELAELIDLTPPPTPWATLAVVVALIAGLTGFGASYLTQTFLGGPCRPKQPKITVDKDGNQSKSGADWQCQAGRSWLQKGTWRKGKREGEWRTWYPNGYVRSEGSYIDGLKDGIHRTWHANGNRASQTTWSKGLQQGTSLRWYPNGSSKATTKWQGGAKMGVDMRWYPSGKQQQITTYKNAKRHGKTTEWYTTGKMKLSGTYHKAQPCGSWLHWNDQGQLQKRVRHKPCSDAARGPFLMGSELKPNKLSGKWRKTSSGKSLSVKGKLENSSKSTFTSIVWHKEMLLYMSDGQVIRRKDAPGSQLSAINGPLAPNESFKIQWSDLGRGALHVDSDKVANIKQVTLRVAVKLTTSSGVVVSYVFYQASLPLPTSSGTFDLRTQPAASVPGSTAPSKPANSKPTKRKSDTPDIAPPPPPPPPR